MFVNIIGATIIDMAWIGSITSVKSPIAEDGRPKPRKPFIKPDMKKVNIKNKIIYILRLKINSYKSTNSKIFL